jgi:ribosomal protein S18 acetylase RimI-like enzyme
MVPVHVRPAEPSDATFLSEMLVAAAFWRPDGPTGSVREILERPELAHYIAGWPRPGDLGVVAEDENLVGAAWIRLLPECDPGFGFVNSSTPELSMGVVQKWRRRGVGAYLLEALISSAREHNLVAMSLSVEMDNDARRLYERFGFQQVGKMGESLTMLLHL